MSKFNVGDVVKVIEGVESSYYSPLAEGIVQEAFEDNVLVKFHSGEFRHDCEGMWYASSTELVKIEESKKQTFNVVEVVEVVKTDPREVYYKVGAIGVVKDAFSSMCNAEFHSGDYHTSQSGLKDWYVMNSELKLFTKHKMKNKFDDSKKLEAILQHQAGAPWREISRNIGVPRQTIGDFLVKHGFVAKKPAKKTKNKTPQCFEVGDVVEVIATDPGEEYYQIGASGIVVTPGNSMSSVKFTNGNFRKSCDGTWACMNTELKLVKRAK